VANSAAGVAGLPATTSTVTATATITAEATTVPALTALTAWRALAAGSTVTRYVTLSTAAIAFSCRGTTTTTVGIPAGVTPAWGWATSRASGLRAIAG